MPATTFWPRESRNLIGLLSKELSTEVNLSTSLAQNFDPTSAIAKEEVCRGKCVVLLRYCRRSRIIVIISLKYSLRSRRKRGRGRGARTREKNGFWESPFSGVLAPLPPPRLRLLRRLFKVQQH